MGVRTHTENMPITEAYRNEAKWSGIGRGMDKMYRNKAPKTSEYGTSEKGLSEAIWLQWGGYQWARAG